jgi:hypothetical protein
LKICTGKKFVDKNGVGWVVVLLDSITVCGRAFFDYMMTSFYFGVVYHLILLWIMDDNVIIVVYFVQEEEK